MQLVEANGGSPKHGPGGTQFPILTTVPAAGRGLSIKGGISPDALTVVTSVQPYQRRDAGNHPLAILNRLSNLDKHRRLVVSVAQSVHTKAYLSAADGSGRVGGEFQPSVVRPGEPLAAFQLPTGQTLDQGAGVEATGSAFVGVAIGEPIDDRPITEVLEEILKYVQFQVVARLEPLIR